MINRVEKLQQMLLETPTDTFLLFAMGLEMVKDGNDEKALDFFKKILAVDENYCALYYHLGKLYERQNHEQIAMSVYEKGLVICKKLNEQHNFNELRSALDML